MSANDSSARPVSQTSSARTPVILLAGGGHAHLVALRHWRKQKLRFDREGPRVILVSPTHETVYSGAVTSVLAGRRPRESAILPTRDFARSMGVDFVEDRIVGLDLGGSRVKVHLSGGDVLICDIVSLDTGSESPDPFRVFGVPNRGSTVQRAAQIEDRFGNEPIAAPLLALRPLSRCLATIESLDSRARSRPLRMAVIGGGAAGVEVAIALRTRWSTLDLTVIEAGPRLLSEFPEAAHRRFARLFSERGIRACLGRRVLSAVQDSAAETESAIWLELSDGRQELFDLVISAISPRPGSWLEDVDLEKTAGGRLRTDLFLRTSDRRVFAAGDIAEIDGFPRPPAGIFAVRAGEALAENLLAAAQGFDVRSAYSPQKTYLALMIDGRGGAVAVKGEFVSAPRRSWGVLKTWIDQRFVASIRDEVNKP